MMTTNTTTPLTLPAPAGVSVLTLDPRTGRVVCAGAVLIFEVRPGQRPAAITVGGARFDQTYPEPWAVRIDESGAVDSPLGRCRDMQGWAQAVTGRTYTIFGEREQERFAALETALLRASSKSAGSGSLPVEKPPRAHR